MILINLWNNVFFCRQQTERKKKQNWVYFVRSRLTSPKQSRKKIERVLNFFSTLGLIASIKKLNKYRENIIQCCFYGTSFTFLRLINKAPPSLLLVCRKNI